MRRQLSTGLVVALALSACGAPKPTGPEEEIQDSGTELADGGFVGGQNDAGTSDAGVTDAGVPPSSPVRINELYVDRDLSGDRVEYVELSGPVGESLSDLHLRLLGPDGGVRYDLEVSTTDAEIGASGTWVVGGNLASGRVDEVYGLSSWGLDNSTGAVQLIKRVDSSVELIDVIGYGQAIPSPSTPPSATSEGAAVALPTEPDTSLGRRPESSDTDDNGADFCVQASSGGAENGPCL